jgi:hypothetical protein
MQNESSSSPIFLAPPGGPSAQTTMLRLQLVYVHVQKAHDDLAAAEQLLGTLLGKE